MNNKIKSFKSVLKPNGLKFNIETYGCQMNVADSEIVVSILEAEGYKYTDNHDNADIVLINTCSIRDNAEKRIFGRLGEFKRQKRTQKNLVVGVIGCMAERLKDEFINNSNNIVDIVVGPDSYRSLPSLLEKAFTGEKGIDVQLSTTETYDDISPVRIDKNGISAYVAIMRGCNNFCTYCVVPYTRGRERSRNPYTIIDEVKDLYSKGYKEVSLLGQNVNSYNWKKDDEHISFPKLMELVAEIAPDLRVRFSTSHPKDISDELIYAIAKYHNICSYVHLPAQSGSSRMLKLMNRHYDREWYMERINKIREVVPECAISTDIIAGFCGETLEDHQQTLSLIQEVDYTLAYMFKYSLRPGTKATLTMDDDVSEEEKTRRLNEIIDLQRGNSLKNNKRDIGKTFEVLIEGVSKRSDDMLYGRSPQNKVIVFKCNDKKAGDYVDVKITDCSSGTLMGELVTCEI